MPMHVSSSLFKSDSLLDDFVVIFNVYLCILGKELRLDSSSSLCTALSMSCLDDG